MKPTGKEGEKGLEPLDDNVFAAEAILKSRKKKVTQPITSNFRNIHSCEFGLFQGKIEYYIKWRGWPSK